MAAPAARRSTCSASATRGASASTRQTGALWIADVGQNAFEEIDRVDPVADAGANLGWNVMEAAHCFADAGCTAEGLLLPLAEYGRDLGCAVTGGEVYRGDGIAGLDGWYLFADYCTGFVFGIPADAAAPDRRDRAGAARPPRDGPADQRVRRR